MDFTLVDRVVIQSYVTLLDGLAAYLGNNYEFVLYSLEDMERSVVKIINGQYTGRDVNAPISNMARSILNHFQEENDCGYVSYVTNNQKGETLRFTAIAIRGENDRIVGILCINSYQQMSQEDVLAHYFENPEVLTTLSPPQNETVLQHEIVDTVLQVKQSVEADPLIAPALKNKEIVFQLNAKGVFQFKNAVIQVASALGISKNTVYMHLRNSKHASRP